MSEENGTHPLEEIINALQRLKVRQNEQEKAIEAVIQRVENLETAFEMAAKNSAKSMQEFLDRVAAENASNGEPTEGETSA